jgi:hypothetical protein
VTACEANPPGPGQACCYADCVYSDFWGGDDAQICLLECGIPGDTPMTACDDLGTCLQNNCANECG